MTKRTQFWPSNTGKQTSIIAEISEPGKYYVSVEAYNGFQGTNFDDGDYELKIGIPTEDNTKEESEGNDSIQKTPLCTMED